MLDELELTQTTSTPSFSVWGNFALTQTDEEHPIARRVHIAFIAPTPAHVERFGQAGIAAGFDDAGPAGPRPNYAAAAPMPIYNRLSSQVGPLSSGT